MTAMSQPWWTVSEWEFHEARRRARAAIALPRGQRTEALRRVAVDYDVSPRTLRRWLTYDVRSVTCGEYEALFVLTTKRPSQVTPWEKAA